jgi:hypothetical protein
MPWGRIAGGGFASTAIGTLTGAIVAVLPTGIEINLIAASSVGAVLGSGCGWYLLVQRRLRAENRAGAGRTVTAKVGHGQP